LINGIFIINKLFDKNFDKMNPIMKCCGYYCSCILIVSFFFYGILIYLIQTRNWWIIRDFPHDTDSKVQAITLAMVANAVCLAGCIGCTWYGRQQELKELAKLDQDDDDILELKQSQ
jgi:hypothetical protein